MCMCVSTYVCGYDTHLILERFSFKGNIDTVLLGPHNSRHNLSFIERLNALCH